MLEEDGYSAHRTRGSFGGDSGIDIVACNTNEWIMESVKSTKQKYYSYNKEIEKLRNFKNHPLFTRKRFVVFHKGKLKVLWESCGNL